MACLATLAPPRLAAQTPAWPSQPITVVVPFAAGGNVDTAARLVTTRLADQLKQAIVIENIAGASGSIGTQRVVAARPDGYTLLFAVAAPINVAPLLSPGTIKYNALKDLAPVGTAASSAFVLVGKPGLAASTTSELVKLARSQPGRLSYGTDGTGGHLHLTGEMIKQIAGIDLLHVPYKSGPQVLTELAGGQLDLAVLPLGLAQGFIREGKIKAFGVTTRQRTAAFPALPSLSEAPELQTLDVESWLGLLAPAKTDPAIVTQLAKALEAVLADPEVVAKMATASLKPLPLSPEQFGALLARERQTLGAVITSAGIKLE